MPFKTSTTYFPLFSLFWNDLFYAYTCNWKHVNIEVVGGETFTWGAQFFFLVIMVKKSKLLSKPERLKKTSTEAWFLTHAKLFNLHPSTLEPSLTTVQPVYLVSSFHLFKILRRSVRTLWSQLIIQVSILSRSHIRLLSTELKAALTTASSQPLKTELGRKNKL